MSQRWRVVMSIVLAVTNCRYRYDLLPSPGEAAAGANGEAAAPNSGGSVDPGGTTMGGAPDLPLGTDNAGVPSTNEGGARTGGTQSGGTPSGGTQRGSGGSSTAGTTGSAGNGGTSGNSTPPDMALCKMGSYGGHNYLLCSEQRSWVDANGGCVAIGMRLARVDDAGENQWLLNNAYKSGGNNSYVWLGGTDQAQEGDWRWTDGSLFWVGGQNGLPQNGLFTGWYLGEPNNINNAENCVSLETKSTSMGWYDTRCERPQPYICESL